MWQPRANETLVSHGRELARLTVVWTLIRCQLWQWEENLYILQNLRLHGDIDDLTDVCTLLLYDLRRKVELAQDQRDLRRQHVNAETFAAIVGLPSLSELFTD